MTLTNNHMKKVYSFLLAFGFLFLNYSFAQRNELWGVTPDGGERHGAIFKVDSLGGNFEYAYYEESYNGSSFGNVRLLKSSDGFYYIGNLGLIFRYDSIKEILKPMHIINQDTNGFSFARIAGPLIESKNGKIIGMSESGGANGVGFIFEYSPNAVSYTHLTLPTICSV